MEFKDYYAILGVPKTATEKEIKQAYRKLARKLHPDLNPGDKASESRFKDINEAYEVLGDTAKRAKYDELGANWRQYEQAQQAYARGAEGAPGGSWTWTTAGGPGGFHTINVEDAGEFFGEGSPFSDFFNQFFGGAAAAGDGPRRVRVSSRGRRRQGEDVEQGVHLTLDQAYRGDTVRVSIKHGGHARTVDVRIPAGVKDGARVRVAGEGDTGTGGAPSGDLYLHVQVLPHPTFERKGQDLLVKLPVPITTAVLGGQTAITTIAGRTLRLRIPEGTQPGQVFRLRGHGMPIVGKADQFGDLLATVEIVLPKSLSEDQRRHYEALAKLEG